MADFLQLHMLTSYGPSCLNRDDTGRPKTAVVGGADRLRISSQSLKRAWRTSDIFNEALGKHVGIRTRRLGDEVTQHLAGKGIDKKKAEVAAKAITSIFKSRASAKEQIFLFSRNEWERALAEAERLAADPKADVDASNILLKEDTAADSALWGRMMAAAPEYNREAAAQVAHAVTTHKASAEDDYFSAVDDLGNPGDDEGLGAGHIGVREFGAGVFYIYTCIDRDLLRQNLSGDAALAATSLGALIQAAATVSPSGHQASYASRAYASYVLAETGNQQPRSLVAAFTKPVMGQDQIAESINRLDAFRSALDTAYGQCWSEQAVLNAASENPTGSLTDVIDIAKG